MYYDGTDWVRLAAGTSGQLLKANGAAAPAWMDQSAFDWFGAHYLNVRSCIGDLSLRRVYPDRTRGSLVLVRLLLARGTATALTDAFVSDTLTASLFVGSGSTTTAIDLPTAEVNGLLPVANGGTGVNSLSDLIALTTNTTGNYVQSVTTSVLTGLSGGSSGSEGAALTLRLITRRRFLAMLRLRVAGECSVRVGWFLKEQCR